jgi:hemolysin activation/secretion protein
LSAALLALLLGLAAPSPERDEQPPPPAPARVSEIEIRGASAFSRDDVLSLIRLQPGEPLRRDPDTIAAGLASRYRIAGYPGARVAASFDAATGRLVLDVDEGTLVEVRVEGLGDSAARRAHATLGLQTGRVLREADIWEAFARLERESEGTIHSTADPPYTVEQAPGGARLVVPLESRSAGFLLRPWGPRAVARVNRVDGLSLGLFSEFRLTDASAYNHLRFTARASWAFSAKTARYVLGVSRPFLAGGKLVLGYSYHDLTDSDDGFRRFGLEEAPGGAINTEENSDYFRRLGHEAYAFFRAARTTEIGVSFRSDGYTSLPVVTGSDEPNPAIEEGRMRSFVGAVRWASEGDLFRDRATARDSYLLPSLYLSSPAKPERWRAEATYELSTPGLGSDFDFSRFIGRLRFHRPLGTHHVLDAGTLFGFTGGDPPRPKRFFLGGLGTLPGFEKKEFTGRHMALFAGEWTVKPGRFWPAIIPFYDGGLVWGGEASSSSGWRNDAGLALRWPPESAVFARVSAAVPLDPVSGTKRTVKWNLRVQIPF